MLYTTVPFSPRSGSTATTCHEGTAQNYRTVLGINSPGESPQRFAGVELGLPAPAAERSSSLNQLCIFMTFAGVLHP